MRFPLVVATGNADKAREICEILTDVAGRSLAAHAFQAADGGDIGFVVAPPEEIAAHVEALVVPDHAPDVEETGTTLEANARIKAHGVGRALGLPAIADDTGLEVDALDGAPGVYSARYAGPDATYADNVVALLDALASVAEPRAARFATVALAWFPDGSEIVARGVVEGTISTAARGTRGFGYDPVFAPAEGDGRTFAEMTADEKHAVSHRARAFRALAAQLDEED